MTMVDLAGEEPATQDDSGDHTADKGQGSISTEKTYQEEEEGTEVDEKAEAGIESLYDDLTGGSDEQQQHPSRTTTTTEDRPVSEEHKADDMTSTAEPTEILTESSSSEVVEKEAMNGGEVMPDAKPDAPKKKRSKKKEVSHVEEAETTTEPADTSAETLAPSTADPADKEEAGPAEDTKSAAPGSPSLTHGEEIVSNEDPDHVSNDELDTTKLEMSAEAVKNTDPADLTADDNSNDHNNNHQVDDQDKDEQQEKADDHVQDKLAVEEEELAAEEEELFEVENLDMDEEDEVEALAQAYLRSQIKGQARMTEEDEDNGEEDENCSSNESSSIRNNTSGDESNIQLLESMESTPEKAVPADPGKALLSAIKKIPPLSEDKPPAPPRPKMRAARRQKSLPASMMKAYLNPTTPTLCIPPHALIKVLKGEIHNVLTVMRADQRYVSRLRFTEEIVAEDDEEEEEDDFRTGERTATPLHPVVQALQELHSDLTTSQQAADVLKETHYLEPFCQAIQRRDISAAVTGAALAALHKFVLYGFLSTVAATGALGAREHVMRIAHALVQCTFEESSTAQHSPRRGTSVAPTTRSLPSAAGSVSGGSVSGGTGSTRNVLLPGGQKGSGLHHAVVLSTRKNTTTVPYDDEQTVLKLLDLATLIVRTSLQLDAEHLLDSPTIVQLLETCLHVSHRAESASPLLKSAALSALSQIVLQVFAAAGPEFPPVMEARRDILARLASLLNPTNNNQDNGPNDGSTHGHHKGDHHERSKSKGAAIPNQMVVANSLTLLNIALETCREPLTQDEVVILQNDVCRYLLQWSSTTHDLMLLSLTLRVIFNLFSTTVRNHLKVPLEVFLTSVHLRILESISHSPEEREVALESLLEFCQEPALMQDIYLNYDCDVACTNLYESIVTSLGKVAIPPGWELRTSAQEEREEPQVQDAKGTGENGHQEMLRKSTKLQGATLMARKMAANPPVTHLQRLAMEGLLAVLDSIAKRCQELKKFGNGGRSLSSMEESIDSGRSSFDDGHTEFTPEELFERKRRKHALVKVAKAFNTAPMSDTWIKVGVQEGVLESESAVDGVAEVLFTASGIDKSKLGIYLSKGPDKDFPFHASVREAFVNRYDFGNLTFAAALRLFLSKFRLPGEAQCIDRFMEAFSKALYSHQAVSSSRFKNSDAVYVLAFSTIMLNTDLHNPTIKEDRRMTKEQFIKNNRGINDGEDLPTEFLSELYDQIKDKQIEVRKELGDFMKKHEDEDFRTVWDNMLTKKGEVATAFFTPAGTDSTWLSGFHDKEMFVVLSKYAVQAFAGIFQRSWDDTLVVRALGGLQTLARVAAYMDCDAKVDEVLQFLFPLGSEYIMCAIVADHSNVGDSGASVVSRTSSVAEDDETTYHDETESPIPYGLLCSNVSDDEIDITGSSVHRGLLALDCGFVLMRKYSHRVTKAWPDFVECLCALRDARALPAGLSDLDDFADSSGKILPLSSFAITSQKRLDEYYMAALPEKAADNTTGKGWSFGAFFRKKPSVTEDLPESDVLAGVKRELSTIGKTLLAVAEAADVESVVQIPGTSRQHTAEEKIRMLLDNLDSYPYKHDPVGEQHSIFCLELATRALLFKRDRAIELFPPYFLPKFEKILGLVTAKKVPAPFVIERIVVTILRCCIHLYEIAELRPHLRAALQLFVISLPKTFIKVIADRMACGLAIILRSSFHYFETHTDWTLMGDTLDTLAHYRTSRVFVFDGIASTVEFALLHIDDADFESKADGGGRPVLSKEACIGLSRILIRFILGFYQNDFSLALPAMLCLEKIYRRYVELLLEQRDGNEEISPFAAAPDKEFWQNVAVAIYSVCRSPDPEVSDQGVKSFRRIIMSTAVEEIPDDKWVDVLFLMVSKQPPIVSEVSRGNTFSSLVHLLQRVLPRLSHNPELGDDLVDLIQQFAQLTQENLRQGRRGSVSPLFEQTLKTVTELHNQMTAEGWNGEAEFSSWASETLLAELERVGAAGAALQNQMAVRQKT